MVVGREVELDHLRRAFHAARDGGSRCVFLVGEGGVGKTRVLAEVGAEGRQLGLSVMAGRAPVTSPVAFSVVSEALRSWLRAHPTVRTMAPFDTGLRLLLPEWPVDTPADVLSDAQLRLLALEGVVRLVQEIAATSRGAVILLDDLHAADADGVHPLARVRYRSTRCVRTRSPGSSAERASRAARGRCQTRPGQEASPNTNVGEPPSAPLPPSDTRPARKNPSCRPNFLPRSALAPRYSQV